jgi:hypothetical protein
MADRTVNDPSPEWEAMEQDRRLPRIFITSGQRGVRAAGETYLPKYAGETGSAKEPASEYGKRLARTFLVNFYRDAVQNLVGRIFASPLVLSEDMPEEIERIWGNIDACGTSGDLMAQRVCLDALGQGVSHVMVDYPGAGEFENLAAEERAGRRPRWVHYKAHEVIEALGEVHGGRPYLKRSRIREAMTEADGYDYHATESVREYVMGDMSADLSPESPYFARFRIHVPTDDGEWRPGPWSSLEPSRRGDSDQRSKFVEAPLVPFYGDKTGYFAGRPSLIAMSDLNLQHYQLKANIDNMEFTATVPTLLREGGDAKVPLQVGAGRVIDIPEGAKLSWLEITGNGVAHAKDSLRHLEEHIRLAGREPMVKKATGSELATVRLLDEAQHLTLAQAWAVSWVSSINECLEWTAAWMGLPRSGSVRIDESVLEALGRPEGFESVKELSALGVIGPRKTIEEAMRYGVLDRDTDIDAVLDEMEATEPPALQDPAPQVLEVSGIEV